MNNSNISDLIEQYLKQILSESEKIEIRRAEMAHQFNCVPSQINYVINTRFTVQKGYVVESKRGGGGYIRIMKVRLSDATQVLDMLDQIIGETLSQKDAFSVLQKLFEEKIVTKREANLMLALIDKEVFQLDGKAEGQLRARLMKKFLTRLGYETEE